MSRSNGYTSYRGGSTARPSSAELVEIHVYIVPPDVWREHYNNLLNQQVTELISAGIIRVHGEQKLYVLRDDIEQQIGADLVPRDYVFLRSVGRSITKLRTKQEYQLKAKHFALPIAYTPELYILEISPEDRDRSSQGSTRPQTRSPVYTNNENRQRKPHKSDKFDAYTNHTNEDSGINVLTPEDQYEADRRKQEEEQRQQDLQKRLRPADDDDRENGQRRLQDDQDDDEWERRRREEEERRQREEEERRRREEERRRREEEENRRAEEERRRLQEDRDRMAKEQKFSGSDEDLNRFPSPPPMHRNGRDTESGKLQRKEEIEKLKKELEAAREQRRQVEKQREELVKKAKLMQTKTQNRRNHARDIWKKRYFEEKKKTPPLEEQCNRLRHELDIIHRKLMNTLEGPTKEKSTRTADLKPSQKNNYKIQATRLTHEIDDVRRRLENAKMKLTAEMKLRNQAETELRALRAELTQKKIHLTLSRNQQLAAMTPATSQELYTAPALTPRS